jgi:hypothetical protein
MVPVSGQPLVRLDVVRKPKHQNFYVFLISVFLQPVHVQIAFNQERQYTYNATLCSIAYGLSLLGYPTSLIGFNFQRSVLWSFNVAVNYVKHLGLYVHCPVFARL